MEARIRHAVSFLVFTVFMILTIEVFGETTTLSWTPPIKQTTCTDAGDLTNLAGFKIFKMIADITDPAITSHIISGLLPGDHTFVATAYNADGEESLLSNAAVKTTGPLVVQDTTVFTIVKVTNRNLLVVVGTVPLGTECDETESVNGHYVVPIDSATWTGTVRPLVVVAKCG